MISLRMLQTLQNRRHVNDGYQVVRHSNKYSDAEASNALTDLRVQRNDQWGPLLRYENDVHRVVDKHKVWNIFNVYKVTSTLPLAQVFRHASACS